MSTSTLSPAGSSTYSSNTLHVGDGTWDSGRDDFLLPNLQGLNFATMQYNGMANRFRALPEYHRLIAGHGVLAAIVFLLIVPAAIFSAKFMRSDPRRAVKLHVYLQILTVFLLTVVVVLGYFAVGPERSLTNPHHGIGIAIYVAVLVQFIFGWIMSKIERRRKNLASITRTPTKVWIHKLLGRSIALLGLVQIPLGLTLYGSPKVLFILYALAAALLLLAYLALDRYYFEKRPVEFGLDGGPEFYSDYGSYLSGSRTDYTQDNRRRPQGPQERERESSHWGRKALAGVGALGAYEAYKHRRSQKREEREQIEIDEERRHQGPPRGGMASSGAPSSRPSSRPPPGVVYGTGNVPVVGPNNRLPPPETRPARMPPHEESRLSRESWEDEKYNERRQSQRTWRDRILGVGAGAGVGLGLKSLFDRRKKREEDYVDSSSYRPPLGGSQNMVSQTDVSRVEQGQAPMSPPNDPRRQERMGGIQPMTPTQTPSRAQRRPRQSVDSLSYDDEESFVNQGAQHIRRDGDDQHTLRNSIATLGAVAGFREWSKRRKERRERQRADQIRRTELDNEENYNRRNSMNYPQPHDANGRRPSTSGTLLTGVTGNHDHGFAGSNPELSRTTFQGGGSRPPQGMDTRHPPLPAAAGMAGLGSGSGGGPSTVGPSISQPRVNQTGYQLPPPPPGPPPGMARPTGDYRPPEPGSLQMPPGAVNPDPGRLMSQENVVQQSSSSHAGRDTAAGVFAGAAAANMANQRRRNSSQSQSPSRYHSRDDSRSRLQKLDRRGSTTSASVSQINTTTANAQSSSAGPNSPPVAVKVKMHNDGRHVTLRRLSEEEAAAERSARRQERMEKRSSRRTRRGSSLSSDIGNEDSGSAAPPGSNQRYRRSNNNGGNGGMRASSQQPIENVPPPPAASTVGSLSQRPGSELNLPPPPAHRVPTHSMSPHGGPVVGSGISGDVGSPGDAGTGTDISAFADNRRRRRAERARRLEAARGNRVEFE
ncbi:hypothetical protein LTR36_001349 [Oleoguttula mirabilis]|uniref:Cytochrome b561 domain-containing protein n=1 Tax=Oleoguttula mirabilis TaxID=1507867 RepID=A0AAV9JNK3_9PEZI|nr:hypothetical protein LTR36_001349 [Oleoguttula mirabilis]